jgi:sigma-54 specific flagellar transcriptional regulator A
VDPLNRIVGHSPAILEVKRMVEAVAKTDSTVLLNGESGTGKEVVAQTIHLLSNRSNNSFIPVNCGAIPAELLESELFGHEKGAFTGAYAKRMGRFELAEQGSLFLDEIGDMPTPMQVKILRVLQEKKFERVGGGESFDSDTRIIAATHRKLIDRIETGDFREDLFYRLNVFPIELPALRERKEDIPLIINDLAAQAHGEPLFIKRLSPEVLRAFDNYSWPGNIRELKNVIERLMVLAPVGTIDIDHLPSYITTHSAKPVIKKTTQAIIEIAEEELNSCSSSASVYQHAQASVEPRRPPSPARTPSEVVLEGIDSIDFQKGFCMKKFVKEMEVEIIKKALSVTGNHISNSAVLLKISRTTLSEKIKKNKINTKKAFF